MRRTTTVIISVIALMIGAAASLPARANAAGPNRGAAHRLVPHHAARHAASRHLTVRRRGSAPVAATRDFDPVPPDPLVIGFFRGLDGATADARAYAPLDLDQPFGPRAFRDF